MLLNALTTRESGSWAWSSSEVVVDSSSSSASTYLIATAKATSSA